MKTAMQELIAYCEQQAGTVASEDYRMGLEDVIGWCQRHYLDKEKQQIMDAHWEGEFHNGTFTSEEYYTKTYNHE